MCRTDDYFMVLRCLPIQVATHTVIRFVVAYRPIHCSFFFRMPLSFSFAALVYPTLSTTIASLGSLVCRYTQFMFFRPFLLIQVTLNHRRIYYACTTFFSALSHSHASILRCCSLVFDPLRLKQCVKA